MDRWIQHGDTTKEPRPACLCDSGNNAAEGASDAIVHLRVALLNEQLLRNGNEIAHEDLPDRAIESRRWVRVAMSPGVEGHHMMIAGER